MEGWGGMVQAVTRAMGGTVQAAMPAMVQAVGEGERHLKLC